jgi:hypothetical protein
MVHLVAKKALTYERRHLKAGDPFVARPHHARWLLATKLAAPVAPPARPTPPPEVAPAPVAPVPTPDPDPPADEPAAGPLTDRVRRVVGRRPPTHRKA